MRGIAGEADGSLYRATRHGWGDPSLLYHSPGLAATPHPSAGPPPRRGLRAAAPPAAKDGRSSLFGALSGSEAGGVDAWLGNELIDPTKGRRPAAPPHDPKGRKGLGEVLSLAKPGEPGAGVPTNIWPPFAVGVGGRAKRARLLWEGQEAPWP